MNSKQHFVQAICEVHRYEVHDHRTDGVTLHGLDEDDRKVLWMAFAESMVTAVEQERSLCIKGVEHMDVSWFFCSDYGLWPALVSVVEAECFFGLNPPK